MCRNRARAGLKPAPYVLGRNGVPELGTGGFETRPYILGRNGEAGMGKVLSTLFHLGGEDLEGAQEARVRQGRHVQDEVLHAGLLELGDAIPDQ